MSGILFLRGDQCTEDRIRVCVRALCGARNEINEGILPADHLWRQRVDHGTGVACQALRDFCRYNSPVLHHNRRFDIAVPSVAPAYVSPVLEFALPWRWRRGRL